MLRKVEIARKTVLFMMIGSDRDMHSADALVECLDDFMRHMGTHIDALDGVHAGHDVGQRNFEGKS